MRKNTIEPRSDGTQLPFCLLAFSLGQELGGAHAENAGNGLNHFQAGIPVAEFHATDVRQAIADPVRQLLL